MEFLHTSVLLNETIESLNIKENGVYVDGTLGGGGHSYKILSSDETCSLIGIDQDKEAHAAAGKRLAEFGDRFSPVFDNFKNIKNILGDKKIDGAVLDLGVSSYQLDNPERGFSYMHDAPLDMRMNREANLSAYDVINSYDKEELIKIFYEYGEEKWSKRVAEFIDERRKISPVRTTGELVEIIKNAIPKGARMDGGHPAKRIFQAVRIEVNGELSMLRQALTDFVDVLAPGGRLAVITFHSLEDRITKQVFSELAKGCICPKEFPVCMCNHKPEIKQITRKPVLPGKKELAENSRSKSAKLRVAEKI